MKTIFINRYFYPDQSATSQILSDLAFELAKEGRDIHIVTSRLLYSGGDSLVSYEDVDNVHIHRVWTTRFGRGNLIGRALDYLSFYFSSFAKLLLITSKDSIVVAKTDPPLISVVAYLVCKIRRAKLYNWIQDLFPEVASALGMKGVTHIEGMLSFIRNISIRKADLNIVIGDTMKDRLFSLGVPKSNVRVIYNWSDADAVIPVPKMENRLRSEWCLNDYFVVGYSGNMGRAHDFETILKVIKLLSNEVNIKFLFIGEGAKKAWLEERVNEESLTNVTFKPYQDRSMLSLSLSLPDIHLISLYPELEGLIVPSKFYGIASAGRPTLFIGSPEGEIARVLKVNNCGAAFNIGDAEPIANYIRQIFSTQDRINEMGQSARQVFLSNYQKSIAIDKWRAIL